MPKPDIEAFISANAAGFEKAMRDIRRLTQQTARGASADFKALSSTVQSMSRGVAASLAAIGIGFSLDAVKQAIKDVADIGDVADKVGLTTDALQELRYAADKTGASADTLDRSMANFAKNVSEAASGADNDFARVLKANNIALRDQEGNLRKQDAVLADYADLIKNARNEQDQLRLATIAFGNSGGDLVNMLRGGSEALRDMAGEARQMGAIMSRDMIKSADELDERFRQLTTTVGTALKSAIVQAADGLSDFIDRFRSFENQQTSNLDRKLIETINKRVEVEKEIAELRSRHQSGQDGADAWFDPYGGQLDFGTKIAALQTEHAQLRALEEQIVKVTEARKQEALVKQAAYSPSGPATIIPPAPSSGSRDSFKPDRDAFAEMLGYTKEYRKEQELANRRLEEFGDIALDAGQALVNALDDGKLEGRELLAIVSDIIRQMMSMPGGLSGLISTLFGGGFNPTVDGFAKMIGIPGYARGTNNHPGGLAIVGENGPELLNLPRGSQVFPNVAQANQNGANVVVQVINNSSGTKVREERSTGPDMREMRRIIVEDVKSEFATGGFDGPMRRFGSLPQPTLR